MENDFEEQQMHIQAIVLGHSQFSVRNRTRN